MPSKNPTRDAWLKLLRPEAEQAITQLWRPDLRAALFWRTPRKLDRNGRLTNGIETKQSRLRKFDELRGQIMKTLVGSVPDAARQLVAESEFGDAVRVAFTRDEAIMSFAEFLVGGDNAWSHSDARSGVLEVCFWRD